MVYPQFYSNWYSQMHMDGDGDPPQSQYTSTIQEEAS